MLIPYRVKNPWKRYPYATLTLIGINVLIYCLTTENGLVIRDDVLERYAFDLGTSPFLNIIWAMFLHGNLFHLAGNMLFLWVFSPPVEDRLGIPRFLFVYLATGIVGFALQGMLDMAMIGGTRPGIGASGAIMGIMGAYWYIFSWSIVCVFYWFLLYIRGIWEVKAFWIIGLFILMDLVEGYRSHGTGGVANFAHVGGGAAGALLCLALRIKRDSAEVSEAKASQAEMKDLSLVSLANLDVMRKEDPQNSDILKAMIPQAFRMGRSEIIERAFREAGSTMITRDPALVLYYLINIKGDPTLYQPAYLMRLARYAEEADARKALAVYDMIAMHYPQAAENEVALYRTALCHWEKFHDPDKARTCLTQLLDRYPFGSLESSAKMLMAKLK